MNRFTIRLLPVAAWFAVGGLPAAMAATPVPSWYGDPDTTRQGYEFTNGSLTPAPEILENPYGTPVATVSLGGLSDGWQDPTAPYDLTGVLEDGAWDLGTAGAVTTVLKVAENPPVPGTFYQIQFQVYVVAYFGITSPPGLDTLGLTPSDLSYSESIVANDPLFPGATWRGMVWTGTFDNVTTDEIGFAIAAPSNNTSVVDTFEVFTKITLVPEPSSMVMILLSFSAWTLRRVRK